MRLHSFTAPSLSLFTYTAGYENTVSHISLPFRTLPRCSIESLHEQDEALKLAFPGADRIDKKEIILTQAQADEIESLSRSKLTTKLYILYEGFKGGSPWDML